MKGNIEERACDLAVYIIENRTTVRAAAKKFGVSKSTVHKDIQDRLPQINHSLYLQVKEILEINKACLLYTSIRCYKCNDYAVVCYGKLLWLGHGYSEYPREDYGLLNSCYDIAFHVPACNEYRVPYLWYVYGYVSHRFADYSFGI